MHGTINSDLISSMTSPNVHIRLNSTGRLLQACNMQMMTSSNKRAKVVQSTIQFATPVQEVEQETPAMSQPAQVEDNALLLTPSSAEHSQNRLKSCEGPPPRRTCIMNRLLHCVRTPLGDAPAQCFRQNTCPTTHTNHLTSPPPMPCKVSFVHSSHYKLKMKPIDRMQRHALRC